METPGKFDTSKGTMRDPEYVPIAMVALSWALLASQVQSVRTSGEKRGEGEVSPGRRSW